MNLKPWQKNIVTRQSGFTLLESIIALMILGILIVVVMHAFSNGLAVSRIVRDRLLAMHIAKSNLDRAMQLLANDFDYPRFSSTAIPPTPITVTVVDTDPDKFITNSGFSANVTVQVKEIWKENACKKITSEVTWTDVKKNPHIVAFSTGIFWIQ